MRWFKVADFRDCASWRNVTARLLYLYFCAAAFDGVKRGSLQRWATELGATKSAVRCALGLLERDGLVTRCAGGIRVTEPAEIGALISDGRPVLAKQLAKIAKELGADKDVLGHKAAEFCGTMAAAGRKWPSEKECVANFVFWLKKRTSGGGAAEKAAEKAAERAAAAEEERQRSARKKSDEDAQWRGALADYIAKAEKGDRAALVWLQRPAVQGRARELGVKIPPQLLGAG